MRLLAKVTRDNSHGVHYTFRNGAREWNETQKRYLIVGGPLDGKYMTRYEMSVSDYPTFYEEYHSTKRGMRFTMIWAYTGDRK